MGRVLEIEEGVEADLLPVEDVLGAEALPLLVPDRLLRVLQARHRHSHQIHVVFRLRQLRDVESVPVHEVGVQAPEAVLLLALAAPPESLLHLTRDDAVKTSDIVTR